jgi:transposase
LARYGQTVKDKAVARLLPPERAALEVVSRELGIGLGTLERWRKDVQSRPARGQAWTAGARLEAVITTAAMTEAAKSVWCRDYGAYPA